MTLRQQDLRTAFLMVALSVGPLWAQAALTVNQLASFVQSSIQLKHPDKQVASYLLKLKLSERLDARTIEELQGLGAGSATMEALRKMVETSASLPPAQPKPVRIAPTPIAPPPLAEQKALIERVREYSLNYSKNLPNFMCTQEVTVGYSGLVYVDRDTEMILKVTQEGENIPPAFPIQKVTGALDYDYTRIGEQTHLLPIKAEVRMRHDRLLTRNIVEFHLYRKFGAEASITFDTPEALPEEKTKEQPIK